MELLSLKDLKRHGWTEENLKDPEMFGRVKQHIKELSEWKRSTTLSGTVEELENRIIRVQIMENVYLSLYAVMSTYHIMNTTEVKYD